MFSKLRFYIHLLLLVILLPACSPAPALSTPTRSSSTSAPLQPAPSQSQPTETSNGPSILQAGLSYSDTADDMEISFLDVMDFQATVNEESEILEVLFHMRDIPSTATRRQIRNRPEYMWQVDVYLDSPESNTTDAHPDYYLLVMTVETDPPSGQEILTPMPGEPEVVPISQIWDQKWINNQQGDYISDLEAVADPDLDTITLRAHIPQITTKAAFRFATVYYDGTVMDRPDNDVSSESANLSTPLPENTSAAPTVPADDATTQLIPAGTVRAYPGPVHYAGDELTFEIPNDGSFGDETVTVSMVLDNRNPIKVSGKSSFLGVVLPHALDTTNLSGRHTLKFTTPDGRLNETYSFDVLPAEERPANEKNATWEVNETACCKLHYISGTAAARDIALIAEHFQQAAEDFSAITGSDIDPKLQVYIIDRIWGNGGFGGNGELLISYTDRYYGPTVGGEGLETLARHEFTHAADIGLATTGDGIDFNYEGLALYVAGGHYKPEPFAERGAALFDLGRYVPVGQFIGQHELDYLYPAAMLTYIVETYGEEKMWKFLVADENPDDDQPGSLEAALQATFGISRNDFDQGFQTWLESQDPGQQLDDLRLTIELQDLRREYQETYVAPPFYLLLEAPNAVARSEYLPIVMREARAPANIATELIIANAQSAIVAASYAEAEQLIETVKKILSTGKFEDPLAKEYFEIAFAMANEGYEVLSLTLQNGMATVQVTKEPPVTSILELRKVDGNWQIYR